MNLHNCRVHNMWHQVSRSLTSVQSSFYADGKYFDAIRKKSVHFGDNIKRTKVNPKSGWVLSSTQSQISQVHLPPITIKNFVIAVQTNSICLVSSTDSRRLFDQVVCFMFTMIQLGFACGISKVPAVSVGRQFASAARGVFKSLRLSNVLFVWLIPNCCLCKYNCCAFTRQQSKQSICAIVTLLTIKSSESSFTLKCLNDLSETIVNRTYRMKQKLFS